MAATRRCMLANNFGVKPATFARFPPGSSFVHLPT